MFLTGNPGFSNIWPGLPSCNFTINQFQDPATIKQCETFFPGLSQNVQTLCCWFQSPKEEQMFVQNVCQSNGFPENRVYGIPKIPMDSNHPIEMVIWRVYPIFRHTPTSANFWRCGDAWPADKASKSCVTVRPFWKSMDLDPRNIMTYSWCTYVQNYTHISCMHNDIDR